MARGRWLGICGLAVVVLVVGVWVWGAVSADQAVKPGNSESQEATGSSAGVDGIPGTGDESSVPLPDDQPESEVAKTGTVLTQVDVPSDTIILLSADELHEGAQYTVVFEPYGLGETGDSQTTVVVRILDSHPIGETSPDVLLEGRNALLYLSEELAEVVLTGGTYEGRVGIVIQGDTATLVLQEAKPKS